MGIPINGGEKVYYLAAPGTPQHAMVQRAENTYTETMKTIKDRLATLREGMGLPVWYGYLLTHKGAKVDNLELVYNSHQDAKAVAEKIDAVKGSHGIKFRKKTDAYKQFLDLMAGCPPMPRFQSLLMGEITGTRWSAFGGPSLLLHPDGRYALAVGTGMDLDGWVERLNEAGFQTMTHPDYLRFRADAEEAAAAQKTPA